MAFTLYYTARRNEPATEQELKQCMEIVNDYCADYPYDKKVEDFGVYSENEENVIFSGATKLPGNRPKFMFEVSNYWLDCLTDITEVLENCEWDVTMDDVDLIYDEVVGWRFPTDEEYRERNKD